MSPGFHRLASIALLAAMLYGAYYLIDQYWFGKYQYYQENIGIVQDRLQRFQSMLALKPELEEKIQLIQQDQSADIYYLQAESPTLAATGLQQQARRAIEGNGGTLVSTQILPVNNEDLFPRVTVRVQMTGDTESIQKVLYALESAQPLLFIDNVQVRARTIRQRARRQQNNNRRQRQPPAPIKTQVQLTAQFELAAYMRQRDA